MPVYRMMHDIDSKEPIPARTLHSLWEEQHKYLHTVLLPSGSTTVTKYQVTEVPDYVTLDAAGYPIHKHDGTVNCTQCRANAQDNRE